MRVRAGRALALALILMSSPLVADGVRADTMTLPTGFADSLVRGGFAEPLGLAFVPGLGGPRLLVIEQRTAQLRLIVGRQLSATDPVGIVPAVRSAESERGLLGIAVDPAWPTRPYVYTWSNSTTGFLRLSRFTLNGDLSLLTNGALTMDAASRYDLIADAPDQAFNHNGGALRFGPDGMLYLSVGDDATGCPAQDRVSLRGVILRLRVDGLPDGPGSATRAAITPAGNPFASSTDTNERLVYAYGFRNPFRFHIDPVSGALFVADVGQNSWEEYSRITPGANAGWPWREGPVAFSTCSGTQPAGMVGPIAWYDHSEGTSVMSLGVYRAPTGATQPFPSEYAGDAFYSDYFSGLVRRLHFDGSNWVSPVAPGQPSGTNWAEGATSVADALVGPDGALWYVRQFSGSGGGEVARIVPGESIAPPPPAEPLSFSEPYPNPSDADVRLQLSLPRSGRVRLAVYDLRGTVTRTLMDRTAQAGPITLIWDGRDEHFALPPAGLYFLDLTFDGSHVASRRVVVFR